MKRQFPDPEISLRDSIAFILNSNLGRKALHCKTFPGFAVFLRDLLDEINMLEKSCHMPEFTNHGILHLYSLVKRISNWTCSTKTKKIISIIELLNENKDEPAILFFATLIHDIGMLSQNLEDLEPDHPMKYQQEGMGLSEWVRKTHVLRLNKLVTRLIEDLKIYEHVIEHEIIQSAIRIAFAHDQWPWEEKFSNLTDRESGLAAIICVSDLLDEDSNRCDTQTLINHKKATVLNKAHWIRHSLTEKRISIQNGEVQIDLLRLPETNDQLLPFYDALRNHFKLILLYNQPLNMLGINKLKVRFNQPKGIPEKEAGNLIKWNDIPGFLTQDLLLFNLIDTFLPEALLDKLKLNDDDIKRLQKKKLEFLDLAWYYKINGEKELRSKFEKIFFALASDLQKNDTVQSTSLKYLRDAAISAHKSEDGILVNHICSIALGNIISLINKNNLQVTLHEIRWVIILSLYWFADDYMLYAVKQCVREYKKKDESEGNLLLSLKSLTYLVEQSLSDAEEDINEIKENKIDWINNFNPVDELFLSYCIELVFVRKPEGHVWNELANIWIKKLAIYEKSLESLQARLQIQAKSLYPEVNDPSTDFPKEANKYIYDAWEARLLCNWDDLDRLLDKLVNTVSFGSAESLAVWHLHHNANFKRERDPQIVGLTRRRLFISGQYGAKQHQINEIRDHNFYKKLSKLWELNASAETANIGASERFSCFRLAFLNELFALREWDLMNWISSINQKAQACLVLVQNPNLKEDERVDFSISAFIMLALSAGLKDKEYLHRRLAYNLDKSSANQKEEIIQSLIDLRPMMWYSVISAFFLLSDAIPEHSLDSVAEWCVQYDEYPSDFQSGWRLDWLTFWGDILGYYSGIDNIFEILHPVILKAAGNHFIWHSDDRHAFEQYIVNAPLKKAFEVIDKMFEIDVSQDSNFNDIRWSIVYNATHKRNEIADKYNNKLIDTATSPVLQLYSNYIYKKSDFVPLNDPDKREWIRNDILKQTKNVL